MRASRRRDPRRRRSPPRLPSRGGEAQHFVDGLDIPGQWWTLFQSPELNSLIDRALKQNPTLESAQAALREANENVAAERGALLPSLSGTYEAQRNRGSLAEFGLPGSGGYYYTLNSANVSVSYTLDAFGGIRRQIEALQAQADYARFSLEASYLTLTSNVVAAAITEASLRAQLAAEEDIARLAEVRARHHPAPGQRRRCVAHRRAATAGDPAGHARSAPHPAHPACPGAGSPRDLRGCAARRVHRFRVPSRHACKLPGGAAGEPAVEIRRATAGCARSTRRLLHQATAQVGVATANMLPQLQITGSYGGSAARFADMFSPASAVWSLAGSVTQPLFKGGQLLHQRRAAVAAAQEAAANYKSTVLTAFQNVADALLALQGDADALAAQNDGRALRRGQSRISCRRSTRPAAPVICRC